MRFWDCVGLTLRQFKTRKLRTLLTSLGIGVGIGTIFVLLSFVFGIQDLIIKRIAPTEALLTIDVTPIKLAKLNEDSVRKVSQISQVERVAPLASFSGQVSPEEDDKKADITLNGIEPDFVKYEGLQILQGRALEREGEVLLTEAAAKFFPHQGMGQYLKVVALIPKTDGSREFEKIELPGLFKVVGVVAEQEAVSLYLPLKQLKEKINQDQLSYSLLKVKVARSEDIFRVKEQILAMGYDAQAVWETVEEASRFFQYLKWILGFFGLIALFVASIGMFNTLTISLLERTKDIGFLKAFGAADSDVRNLFLCEASLLGLFGGILGLLMGGFFSFVANFLTNWIGQVRLFLSPWWFVLLMLLFSLGLGLLTGLYPARRAGKINPLEAIRYE